MGWDVEAERRQRQGSLPGENLDGFPYVVVDVQFLRHLIPV